MVTSGLLNWGARPGVVPLGPGDPIVRTHGRPGCNRYVTLDKKSTVRVAHVTVGKRGFAWGGGGEEGGNHGGTRRLRFLANGASNWPSARNAQAAVALQCDHEQAQGHKCHDAHGLGSKPHDLPATERGGGVRGHSAKPQPEVEVVAGVEGEGLWAHAGAEGPTGPAALH